MLKVAVIAGSTRPHRVGMDVARWVYEKASVRKDAEFELVDLAEQNLPLLDESIPPSQGKYEKQHTKDWANKIKKFDAFIFVTAEYNHSIPAALKNALDFIYTEWNNKAAAFVSYGSAGGVRAVEALRLVMGELKIADIRSQLTFSLREDFKNHKTFEPQALEHRQNLLNTLIDDLVLWGEAMKSAREKLKAKKDQEPNPK